VEKLFLAHSQDAAHVCGGYRNYLYWLSLCKSTYMFVVCCYTSTCSLQGAPILASLDLSENELDAKGIGFLADAIKQVYLLDL
jgi:hypothetical protein